MLCGKGQRRGAYCWHHLYLSKLQVVILWSRRLQMVSCIPKAKCSRNYYLTEFFLYLNLDCFSLTWVLYSILLWHLHLTIEFFKDPPFLLIYEMIESDKPMYLSLWHQTFKKVKEELPWESQSLKNNFDMEVEFMSASPTHSSMNSYLCLERVGIMAFCCTSKKIRVQKHRLTVLSVSSYYPWIKKTLLCQFVV